MLQDVYSAWSSINKDLTDDGLLILPSQYKGKVQSRTYLRFNLVLPAPAMLAAPNQYLQLTGQAVYQLYTPAGEGQTKAIELATQLEQSLTFRWFPPRLQTMAGSLQPLGNDPGDPSLSRHDYFLTFLYHGAL